MDHHSTIGTLLLIFTGLTTYKGFMDRAYFEKYVFHVDKILIRKEYGRLLSSGFLHANWLHFGFNMIALIGFSLSIEMMFGWWKYLLIYFASLIGGNLLALYIHRNHGDYRAVGASGAISGIVMASIVLFPEGKIGFIILPVELSSWVFALLFVVISIFGIKSQSDNIGHEAHLGGAIVGVLMTILLQPSIAVDNWWIVALILVPTTAFLLMIVRNPAVLMIHHYWGEAFRRKPPAKKRKTTKSTKTKKANTNKEITLDHLLDKIRRSGMDSLSAKERAWLDRYKDDR